MAEVKGVTWDFEGKHLDIKTSLALCYARGFKGGERLTTAVAVMTAESQRWTGAWHKNFEPPYGEPGSEYKSIDRGLFQINDKAQGVGEEIYDPKLNVDKAFDIFKGRGDQFTAWAAYNSGAYLQYVDEIEAVRKVGTWRLRIPKWM